MSRDISGYKKAEYRWKCTCIEKDGRGGWRQVEQRKEGNEESRGNNR